MFQVWPKQVNQSTLIQDVEKQTLPFDEWICNIAFQGGGYVANFTIYHEEFELLSIQYVLPSHVLSTSLATIHSLPESKKRGTKRDEGLGAYSARWLLSPWTWQLLKLTLVWDRGIFSSVVLFTRHRSHP